ncbi:serine hydrolase domain-containing protein [Sphingosinicella sp. LHD-64]|uniref:serine hydrolase domain-containing protein n=1 Tax=Sphingosinicella sp. LHD-64 TaxID=3072139 RepID=UPI00280FA10F|nr:serine hydrolase domain-containing protein [Sphingosinicella sp. LHD-64]MDQ8755080.1 serine hydrolase domain-containing protein [Sphingosinicella sp. LHD-64]
MFLRRLLPVLVVALVLAGAAWWAGARYDAPVNVASRAKAGPRFEMPVGAPSASTPGAVDYTRLDERIRRLMNDPAMVGLAIAVVEDGQIRFVKGYGETGAGNGDPVTTSTVFRWASLSKGVAADMVALLAGEQRLSLFEPAARYANSLRLPGGSEANVTIVDILSHRTGLFAHAQDAKLEDGEDPRLLRAALSSLHDICTPGTCHAYQNVAYDAASEIVERVTGTPYPAVVRERLFQPLGMSRASIGRAELLAAPSWARGHAGGKNSQPVEVTDSYYRVPAAGGVNGSIEDLAIWMLAQMGAAPDVLSREVLAEVQSPRVNTPGETRRRRLFTERTPTSAYGLGWRVFDYAGHRVVGHHGGVRGYRSMILFDPARRSGIVALWNSSTNAPAGLEYEVMDMVYRLPSRDWLQIDTPGQMAAPAERPDNEGGSA